MAPQRFKIGQEVTPKKDKWRIEIDKGLPLAKPLKSEIYHVTEYDGPHFGYWYICLAEFDSRQAFREIEFEPVISDAALTELLEESLQPQTI